MFLYLTYSLSLCLFSLPFFLFPSLLFPLFRLYPSTRTLLDHHIFICKNHFGSWFSFSPLFFIFFLLLLNLFFFFWRWCALLLWSPAAVFMVWWSWLWCWLPQLLLAVPVSRMLWSLSCSPCWLCSCSHKLELDWREECLPLPGPLSNLQPSDALIFWSHCKLNKQQH